MGKSEQSSARSMANQNTARATQEEDEMRKRLNPMLDTETKRAEETYGSARSAYTGMGGYSGAYDPEEYARQSQVNRNNIATGGYQQPQLDKLRGYTEADRELGGYTPQGYGSVKDAYGNLQKTGGLSDEAADAMRRQAAGSTQSIYSTLGSKLARSQGIAGTGGAGGETAQMARQAAQAGAVATTGANAEIGKLRQAGIIQGTGGLAQFEESVAKGRQEASRQAAGLETDVAAGTRAASAAQQDLMTNAATQKIQAAGGLVNLYNSNPGYVTELIKGIQNQQQITGQLTTQQAEIMQELSKNPGLFGNIMNAVGTLGGAAAGIMTGIGGMSSGIPGGYVKSKR